MFKEIKGSDEDKLLNRYLLIGWNVVAAVLVLSYGIEVVKRAFSWQYYGIFLLVTLLPFAVCVYFYRRDEMITSLRYWIFVGYMLMYGFVLLTGHTNLVFTYIFPLMSLITLYHDARFVFHVGACSLLLNIIVIINEYYDGKITVLNSRDYEIQIALILLCFSGCYMATKVYGEISKINKEKELEVLRLQEERIILEERNRYAFIDALTDLGNRRKYEDSIDAIRQNPTEDCHIVMIDINGLKKANDTIGHVAGDELIVGMAHCMKTAFDDAQSECFRFGGDEFSIISRSTEDVFEKELARLKENIALWRGIHVHKLSGAIGYAKFTKGGSIDDTIRIADEQMYTDKDLYYALAENDRRRRR